MHMRGCTCRAPRPGLPAVCWGTSNAAATPRHAWACPQTAASSIASIPDLKRLLPFHRQLPLTTLPPLQKWDPQLSRDIIAHWLDLMNAQGWIPRWGVTRGVAGALWSRMSIAARRVLGGIEHQGRCTRACHVCLGMPGTAPAAPVCPYSPPGPHAPSRLTPQPHNTAPARTGLPIRQLLGIPFPTFACLTPTHTCQCPYPAPREQMLRPLPVFPQSRSHLSTPCPHPQGADPGRGGALPRAPRVRGAGPCARQPALPVPAHRQHGRAAGGGEGAGGAGAGAGGGPGAAAAGGGGWRRG